MSLNKTVYILLVTISGLFFSCEPGEDGQDQFDRKALLENLSGLINDSYSAFHQNTIELEAKSEAFVASPDEAKLTELKDAFKQSYLAWEACEVYEFGPAEGVMLRMELNTFPADAAGINSAIESGGNFDAAFMTALSAPKKGYPAIDYLLFNSSSEEVVNSFINETKRKEYLAALVTYIKTLAETVKSDWADSYQEEFINNAGTDAGSSLGQLVNQMNYHLEIVINQKIGIPAGKRTPGVNFPEKVEAYYSGYSVDLASVNLETLENIYLGNSQGQNGVGIDDYLDYLKAQDNDMSLNASIKEKLDNAQVSVSNISPELSEAIKSNVALPNKAYDDLKTLLIRFKNDMPSAMGILITYSDEDGD